MGMAEQMLETPTDGGSTTPSEREQPSIGTAKLVFGLLERGLPSLQRGWRTPDPSPTRTGLPKCAAYQEFVEEEEPKKHVETRGRQQKKEGRSPSPMQPWLRLQTPSPEPTLPMPTLPQDFILQQLKPDTKTCWADIVDMDGSGAEDDRKAMQHPLCMSIGSEGHPFSCGPACKYAAKGKGCKDGENCDHCHLCKWKKVVSSGAARPTRSRGQNPRQRRAKKEAK
ncbi:unnamed protein product [Effrenium voratum]|nr:unnamed protein product [Effrenium voratum]CAJ1418500.1 unnamed protein product [Effrenium voratum]